MRAIDTSVYELRRGYLVDTRRSRAAPFLTSAYHLTGVEFGRFMRLAIADFRQSIEMRGADTTTHVITETENNRRLNPKCSNIF